MDTTNKTISIRQVLIIYVLMIASPAFKMIPKLTVSDSKQAAWIAPLVAMIIILPLLFILQKIFDKYRDLSLITVMQDIFGKTVGKTLGIFYSIYITIGLSVFLSYYAQRLTYVYPGISYIFFEIIMLSVMLYILNFDIAAFARTNEILLFIVVLFFLLISACAIPFINVSNFYPVTTKDILPVLKAGGLLSSPFAIITLLLMFGDKVFSKENLFKIGKKSIFILTFLAFVIISVPLGIFGESTANLTQPYSSSIQTITLFNTIERLEVIIVALWIFTDFSFIGALTFSGLYAIKNTFNLPNIKPIINIYILLTFFLSFCVSNRFFEIELLAGRILPLINILFCIIIPLVLFGVGKLRKKI